MAEPTLNYIQCPDPSGTHRMAYWQWGDPAAAHTVLCAHGLSRQGRDFDVLAQALVERSKGSLRVVCPDVVGRGQSDWLKEPHGYQLPQYVGDMLALLAHLKPQVLDWVGTSMGGLIGMGVCAHAANVGCQVRRLVLNDVGPAVQWASIVRIGSYLGRDMHFTSLEAAAQAMWAISSSFGPHTQEQWMALSRHMVRNHEDGAVVLHYDPAIADAVRGMTEAAARQAEEALWALYDGLKAQTLLLRGADSDLLSAATAHAMGERGPRAQLVEFAGVGHAPTLLADDQVEVVARFLLG